MSENVVQNFNQLKSEILEFIKQPIPQGLDIVEQSVPVPFFGDIEKAEAATISLNPSNLEFQDSHHNLLQKDKKRFIDRENLQLKDTDYLSTQLQTQNINGLSEAQQVYHSCQTYFENRPYKRWFNRLNTVLEKLGFSYYKNTLVHIDITPWATETKWSKLDDTTKTKLKNAGKNLSNEIIEKGNIHTLFINGRGTFEHVKNNYTQLQIDGHPETLELTNKKCEIWTGTIGQCKFIAWSLCVQGPLKICDRDKLIDEVQKKYNSLH